jgi:hypothetical protein
LHAYVSPLLVPPTSDPDRDGAAKQRRDHEEGRPEAALFVTATDLA